MKSFKVMIAMAAITFCGSISMAISAEQREQCLSIMLRESLPTTQGISQDQVDMLRRACNSSMMNDGREYAGCMLQLQRAGVPVGTNTIVPSQKAVTGAALCSQGTNFELNTCIANQVQAYKARGYSSQNSAYQIAQQAAQDCRSYSPALISNLLTNGASYSQTKSNEQIVQESIEDLAKYTNDPSYRKPMGYQGGSSASSVSQVPQRRHQVAVPVQQAQPETSSMGTTSSMTDLPEVE
ncbi:hypothetical protein B9G69_017665 [Bdellovibrio sp. SKB1291214]|uniref:hypothetical protein n=1 Tax=Bdellovibrio sp. SKB1291214 TaxID=1732569 RepID=UPI000B51DFCF|nr:hypothetical protein [Bdellovibrio sp. SKB1291214]UYL08871.1 hypothetical protein B9G69_017665 [Bdellovibrio sp. SKB1291214]